MRIALLIPDSRDEFKLYGRPDPYLGPAPAALLEGLQELRDFEFHVVACVHQSVITPARLAENIFFHTVVVPGWGWLRTGYLGCSIAIRRKLGGIRPAIVHAQGTERYCAMAAIRSGFKNIITIHGNMRAVAQERNSFPGSFYWWASRLETFALRRSHGVICNSRYTEELVKPRAKRTWRVPNALQSAFFLPLPKRTLNSIPTILNVGTITSYKNQQLVLDWAADLRAAGHKFRLRFVGPAEKSSYAADFLQKVDSLRSEGWVDYLGHKIDGEMIGLFDSADALIHWPTQEAFGLVVAEALARNLKVFVAATGGVRDITENVPGAERFPLHDGPRLKAAISAWLSNGHAGLNEPSRIMRERYHPSAIARAHAVIYHGIFQEKEADKNIAAGRGPS